MTSPAYDLMESPSRPGTTRPLEAEIKPKIPICAKRPWLISANKLLSSCSRDFFALSLNGSYKLKKVLDAGVRRQRMGICLVYRHACSACCHPSPDWFTNMNYAYEFVNGLHLSMSPK